MIPSVLRDIQMVLGPSLDLWAMQVHGIALALLGAAWVLPALAAMFRRLPGKAPDIEWVSLWRCPRCSSFNRRSFTNCTHCDYSLKVGGAGLWLHGLYERFQKH